MSHKFTMTLPLKKRPIRSSNTGNIAKRLKTLEKKTAKFSDTKLTYVSGSVWTSSVSNLNVLTVALPTVPVTGKVFFVEAIGTLASPYVDVYLVQTIGSAAPVYMDFNGAVGGVITTDKSDQLYIWKHFLPMSGGSNFHIKQSFPKGFHQEVDNFGNSTGKKLWLVIKNNSGGAVTPSFSWNVRFHKATRTT